MAPSSTRVEVGSAEIYFAKKLANNDKKIRDKALKKLKLWITSKISSENGLNVLELQKIWKGLFYCMWFSDKPLVQEELAGSLSEMFHIFNPPCLTGVLFYKTFCIAMGREWLGIDRLRLDKFYMLTKKMMQEFTTYLSRADWDSEMTADFQAFFTDVMTDTQYPDGLKMYYAENQISSIMLVCETMKSLVPVTNILPSLLDPYFYGVAHLTSDAVVRTIRDEILQTLLSMDLKVVRDDGKKNKLKLPFSLLAERLRDLATQKNIKTKNRKILFQFAELYQKQSDVKNQVKATGKRNKKRDLNSDQGNGNTSENLATGKTTDTVESEKCPVVEKRKRKRKRDLRVDQGNIDNIVGNSEGAVENNRNESESQFLDNGKEAGKKVVLKSKKKEKTLENSKSSNKSVTPSILENGDSEIPHDSSQDSADVVDNVKLKLTFSDVTTDEEMAKVVKTSTEKLEKNVITDCVGEKHIPSEEICMKEKNKKQKIHIDDEPRPVMTFIKTPPPNSFFRKSLIKSEPHKKKRKNVDKKPVLSTPMSESNSKKVRIDISKNTAVGVKELKICPTTPFSPTRKPNKSVLKTPNQSGKKSRASDFF